MVGFSPSFGFGYTRTKGGGGVAPLTPNQQFDALIATYSPVHAFNLADAGTRWRDTSATLPATIAGSHTIGRLDDKSGNGHNVTQGTSTSRPALGNSGDLWWMTGDGIDDWLRSTTAAMTQPWWRISALRQVSWALGERMFGPATIGGAGLLYQNPVTPQLGLFNGTLANANANAVVGADAITYEVHNGASSALAIDGGTPATGNPGTANPDGLTIFSDHVPQLFGNFRLYATMAGNGTLTAPQAAEIVSVMALLQGRSL